MLDDPTGECILGVDEAGRGPVLGPMVYGVAYCSIKYAESISRHGFMDSKVLDHNTRVNLLQQMTTPTHELYSEIGWSVRVMSARDIGAGMLRPMAPYNLNAQAHDTTIQLIKDVLALGVNVRQIFVDTVGIAESYQAKLQREFPMATVVVCKKADSLYSIVSVASICAKVTRDAALALAVPTHDQQMIRLSEGDVKTLPVAVAPVNASKRRNKDEYDSDVSDGEVPSLAAEQSFADQPDIGSWGSGYPSDSKTQVWLKSHVNPIFGWVGPIRYSWSTVKEILEPTNKAVAKQNKTIKIDWYEVPEDGQQVLDFSGESVTKKRKDGYSVQNSFGKSINLQELLSR